MADKELNPDERVLNAPENMADTKRPGTPGYAPRLCCFGWQAEPVDTAVALVDEGHRV